MLLTGNFSRSLDEKLRLAIPRPLREAMDCPKGAKLLLVAPETDVSLAIYSAAAFGRWAERLARVSPTRQDVRAFTRLFYAQAQQAELDGQGRIRIPPELVQLAKLEKEVVLLGVYDHLEVWAAPRWRAYVAEKQAHYDEIAETTFGPSPGGE